jgi:nucleoid-associated protein YgaU
MPRPATDETSVDSRLTRSAPEGYNKQTNANAKVRTVTSLGTDFDLLLIRGALLALGIAALWSAAVVVATAAEALSDGRVRVAARIGCPAPVRAWLVGVFVVLFAGVSPAHAGDAGSGGTSGIPVDALVDGLPLPDRVAGDAPRRSSYVVRPGDSLWAIARHALPGADDATIAHAVRRLHAANRAVIGPDADLLLPGQRLSTAAIHPLPDHT